MGDKPKVNVCISLVTGADSATDVTLPNGF